MSHYVAVKHESFITKQVFDALAKISTGILLNDALMTIQCKMILDTHTISIVFLHVDCGC